MTVETMRDAFIQVTDQTLSERDDTAVVLADIGDGDRLDESFAFLDPTGANQLAGLEGQVVVLAYFALF